MSEPKLGEIVEVVRDGAYVQTSEPGVSEFIPFPSVFVGGYVPKLGDVWTKYAELPA